MTKQIGSYLDEVLLDGIVKAFEEVRVVAKQQAEIEQKQKELKDNAQHAFNTIDEIIGLKGTDDNNMLIFTFNGRVHSRYDLEKYEAQKQEILNKFTV